VSRVYIPLNTHTHNRSFWRRVFTGNHLHWYWQQKETRGHGPKTQTNWP